MSDHHAKPLPTERTYLDGDRIVVVHVHPDGNIGFTIGAEKFGLGVAVLEQLVELARGASK